jgi:hypothetical protein
MRKLKHLIYLWSRLIYIEQALRLSRCDEQFVAARFVLRKGKYRAMAIQC